MSVKCGHIPDILEKPIFWKKTNVKMQIINNNSIINPLPADRDFYTFSNSLNPEETPSNSASPLDPSCLKPRQYFHKFSETLKHFEN